MLYTSADSSLPNDERGRRNYRDAFTKEHWNGLEFIEAKGDRGGCQTLQQLMGPRPIANNMSLGWKTTSVPTMEAVEMYYTKNGLPWEDDPETKDIDPYAYNAEAGTVNLHLYKDRGSMPQWVTTAARMRLARPKKSRSICAAVNCMDQRSRRPMNIRVVRVIFARNGFPRLQPTAFRAIRSVSTITLTPICVARTLLELCRSRFRI